MNYLFVNLTTKQVASATATSNSEGLKYKEREKFLAKVLDFKKRKKKNLASVEIYEQLRNMILM